MQYDFSNQVTETLDALDEDTRRRLFSNIMALPEFGEVKALEGRHAGLYRQRIGEWRVIFTMEGDNVLVGYIMAPRAAGEDDSDRIAGADGSGSTSSSSSSDSDSAAQESAFITVYEKAEAKKKKKKKKKDKKDKQEEAPTWPIE